MGLGGWIKRKLFLRWLRGQLEKEGSMFSKVKKALSGWKLLLGVGLLAGMQIYDSMTGSNTSGIGGAILELLGLSVDAEGIGVNLEQLVPAGVIVIGAIGKLWKAQQQARAGASASELLTSEGYIKAARAKLQHR